ncbi:hypothetical protein EON83_07315 [bacterium]|nr:MAG: hypothetical protein EON83_07315 [bacterium]
MLLPSDFFNSNRPITLYGTTPPRLGASALDLQQAAEKLIERIEPCEVDGVVIYDVQDESERTSQPRPFPFLPTLDSRAYSQMIYQLSGLPIITYKCIGGMDEAEWKNWLDESRQHFGISTLSLVGSPAHKPSDSAITLPQAIQITKAHPANFALGGVAIAERHTPHRNECQRMVQKGQSGCDFFISQSVYDSQKTITLLNAYSRRCRAEGITPKRFIFTFAPCGHSKTLDFIKWLGVSVPPHIEKSILESDDPLSHSITLCRSTLCEILEGLEDPTLALGINVESVSNKKDEIEASLELLRVLKEVMLEYSASTSGLKG